MSQEVVTVFKLLGRAEHQTYDAKSEEWKSDLLIQPMMVLEGSDGYDQGMAKGLAQAQQSQVKAKA